MAVPEFTGFYPDTTTAGLVPNPITPFDIRTGGTFSWTDADFFEINTLPPGYLFDGVDTLSGEMLSRMVYFIAIRGGNDDGFSDWQELKWSTTGPGNIPFTDRILFGLSQKWQLVFGALPNPANLFIKQATPTGRQSTWNAGEILINDIPDAEGTASDLNAQALGGNVILSGQRPTYIRTTEPGWEVILYSPGI